MSTIKEKLKSVRVKLFLTLAIVVVIIIVFLVILNNIVLEAFYLHSKKNTLLAVYDKVNSYFNTVNRETDLNSELEQIAKNNNFDLVLQTDENISVYTTGNKDFVTTLNEFNSLSSARNIKPQDIIYTSNKVKIRKVADKKSGIGYILLSGKLDNDYTLYIRIPLASIQESVQISNNFLCLVGGVAILIGGIAVSVVSKRFTEPILELNEIAKNMSNLDFSKKYRISDTEDEINDLGRSINRMSDKLESTIKQLRSSNIELEKDIEEKSKIDEMRKQFISDVSHELKTPIALIQGYAEGLLENVNTDAESRKFYAEVILDESNKMDKLVKQLLELMKLEYGKREFNNEKFNITELISEVIRKSKVMLEENNITIEREQEKQVYVYADEFYIEQVFTNYFTNAIKHAEERNGKKVIRITKEIDGEHQKIRIKVFNTGKNIKE